jgi:hypothetical protein
VQEGLYGGIGERGGTPAGALQPIVGYLISSQQRFTSEIELWFSEFKSFRCDTATGDILADLPKLYFNLCVHQTNHDSLAKPYPGSLTVSP